MVLPCNRPAIFGGSELDTNEAMRALVARSGLSMRAASLEMGRSPTWLSTTVGREGSSEAAIVAELADVCGYSLVLVPSREVPQGAIVIDPPR